MDEYLQKNTYRAEFRYQIYMTIHALRPVPLWVPAKVYCWILMEIFVMEVKVKTNVIIFHKEPYARVAKF